MVKEVIKKIIYFIENNVTKKAIILVFVAFSIILSITKTITFARYAFESLRETYFISNEFFFYSSNVYLDDGVTINDWDGVSEYKIYTSVYNYIDELRWTKEDIPYTTSINCNPSISGSVSCTYPAGTIETETTGGTTNRICLTLTNPNNLEFKDGDYVDVSAVITSTSPYRKSLNLTFKIYVNIKEVTHKVIDSTNQAYLDLVLSNNTNAASTISIGWDKNVVLVDNTNTIVNDSATTKRTEIYNSKNYINQLTFIVPAKTAYKIRYYKIDKTQNYTYPVTNTSSIFNIS